MIYITLKGEVLKFEILPLEGVSCEQNGYYAAQNEDLALHVWPPRHPDLTPCDFFLWGFVKEAVYVRPPLTTLVDLKIISQLR
jgi:hypothetical protein